MTETVRAVGLPLQSVIAGLYDGADLADAFAIMLPDVIAGDIDQLARAVRGNPSWWFRALLACRDALVAPFGVKTSAQLRAQLQDAAAAHIDFFPVVSRTADEAVIGADDKHLDFRTSVLIRRSTAGECCKRANLQRAAATGWKCIT